MNLSDLPIGKNGVDLFNFKHYAKKVQKIIQNNSNNSEPLTIGIYGKWGEGKTSFLNLVENKIDLGKKGKGQKGVLKYHFNPWRYSTEEEMLFDFFDGLSKMMFVNKENEILQKVGKQLLKYSKYAKAIKVSASAGLSPSNKVSATLDISEIMKSLGEDFTGEKPVLEVIIDNINKKLEESKYKIVVFIDDIDRLDKDEIYTILKLIKLNANFNNFVYIVALDENHVAKAIGQRYGETSDDGKLFLEKIINIPIHLPKIETVDFKHFFNVKFKEVIDNLGFSDRKEEINEIRNEFRPHYFRSAREVIRVFNSFFVSAFAIGEEVNLRDLFWIEYLKVKYTNVFDVIKKYNFPNIEEKLIASSTIIKYSTSVVNKDEIFNEHSKGIVEILFPDNKDFIMRMESNNGKNAIETSNIQFKINHPNHFEKYFSYHMEGKVSVVKNRQILQYIIDENEKELESVLIDLRDKYNLEVHRFYSVIEDLIIEDSLNHIFLYDFIFSNLDLFPETEKDVLGSTYLLRVIELIASVLDKRNNNEGIIELAKKLSIYHLCYFTRTIQLKIAIKKELESLIVLKTKEEYLGKPIPFFYDLTKEHSHYKMMMSLWKEKDKGSFNKYIENNTESFNNILKLIRNFAPFSTSGIFINLDLRNYKYMEELIDVGLIYKRIEEYKPELIIQIDSDYIKSFSLTNRPSELENVEQFIYHYKKDKNLLN
ncbi:KAP family P-loop NTPase fold protein [Tenacibaculum retecalamus]|uniref:KAP family P-loop NTPase fold protein n=1 Tax=Tenacibaculum retecalamus TaxID=3018315 RepID=UPI0023D90979|nr:P-loop NTPase fold protein [Tenacibaculum retecalamus]WBX71745.1 P-loop NTPase fold protein [Tenacibaculum retecalamus]